MPGLRSREGVWYADCYFTDEHGVSHRRERSTRTKDDGTAQSRRTAEAKARTLEAALQAGKGRRASATTLRSAYAARLEALVLEGRAKATQDIAGDKAVHVLRFFGVDRDVATITEQELRSYATYAREKRAPATVEHELINLSCAAKAVGVQLPKLPYVGEPRIVERWIDTEQTKALLEHVVPARRAHVLAYRYLGLSWSELYKFTDVDVNRTKWVVRVRGTKRKWRDRTIPIVEHIRHLFAPGFNFDVWSCTGGNNDLTKWARYAGIVDADERFSFNDLRRSYATELVLAGVPTFHVAKLMGHKDSSMVELIYARVSAGDHLSSAVAQLRSPTE